MSSFLPARVGRGGRVRGLPDRAGGSVLAAGARTLAVALVYAPVLWWLGRGLGLRALAGRWVRGEASA